MSTSFYACTFAVDAAVLADDKLVRAQGALYVEEGRGLETLSRGNWFLWTLGRMAGDLHPVALAFLDAKRGVRFEDARRTTWALTTLAPADVPAAAAAVASLLDQARNDPESLLPYFNGDWDVRQIREAIADPQEHEDDDGAGPDYLFLQLNGLAHTLEIATAEAGGVAHLRCDPD